ncbi:hypothetical protein Q604_UNBC03103G0001, partial [human gut metagenome]
MLELLTYQCTLRVLRAVRVQTGCNNYARWAWFEPPALLRRVVQLQLLDAVVQLKLYR